MKLELKPNCMKFLFISEMLPVDTYASEVVFYRHFKRLVDEGHEIHVLTDSNSYASRKKELHPAFKIHLLPNRQWHFPPYKAYGPLQRLRFFYYYHFIVKQLIQEHKIDKLIGFVYGNFLAPLCAYVQTQTQMPLFSFLHDDPVELHFNMPSKVVRNNALKILEHSKTVFIASDAFRNNWPAFTEKFILLYPIPEATNLIATSSGSFVGYSGSVYNEIIPSLERFSDILNEENVKLLIIGNNEKMRPKLEQHDNVVYKPLFETANESNKFLIENCFACIIPYPETIEEMPWIRTCFPSKLIQNTLLNIPTIIVAPSESALGKWCKKNNWLLFCEQYDQKKISALIATVRSRQVNMQIAEFKDNHFNPANIHSQFKSFILN